MTTATCTPSTRPTVPIRPTGARTTAAQLEDRFFYGSISEDAGIADNVMYKGGTADDNNASGMQWKDGVRAMTGELTAYEGKYASDAGTLDGNGAGGPGCLLIR